MDFEGVKKVLKETGEKIIGKGPEVKFRNEVDEYADTNGVSPEVAQKQIFDQYLQDLHLEANTNRAIDLNSKQWRAFTASLNEMFTPQEIEDFEKQASNRAVFRSLTVTPNSVDMRKTTGYYKSKYGKDPDFPMTKDVSTNAKLMEQLINRVDGDLASVLANPDSLKNILAADPALAADIGKMLQTKGLLDKHEKGFKRQIDFEKSFDSFKQDSKAAMVNMIAKPLGRWLKTMVKTGLRPNMNNIVNATGETLRLMGTATVGTGQIAFSGIRTMLNGLNKLRS